MADRLWSLRWAEGMRYAQGGGLTDEQREFREELRLQAAERFARGEKSSLIARGLRIRALGGTMAPGLAGRWTEGLAAEGTDLAAEAGLGRVFGCDRGVVRVRSLIQIIEARRWRPAR